MSLPYHGVASLTSISTTQNDKTNNFIIPTREQLRRDCLKFRREIYARFQEDDALESTSISVTSTQSKHKKKRSKKKKQPTNTDNSQMVIETKESITIALDETKLNAVTESQKVTPIKLKMSRCDEKNKNNRKVCYKIS